MLGPPIERDRLWDVTAMSWQPPSILQARPLPVAQLFDVTGLLRNVAGP
jgi:hypothetical protein